MLAMISSASSVQENGVGLALQLSMNAPMASVAGD
jgi:hypothetical protein